jgi:hypothetical protein
MGAENFLAREDFGKDQRVKQLTTASGNVTYTAKVGKDSDNFIHDRVIRVTSTSGNSMTITVPDGYYYGQEILVIFEAEANDETVDVSTTTGDDATQMTAAGGYWNGQWHGSTLGWITRDGSAT